MGWESFDVVGFDLGPLLQGQMRIAKLSFCSMPFYWSNFNLVNTLTNIIDKYNIDFNFVTVVKTHTHIHCL